MPGDPLQKVNPGARLEVPAAAWNAFIDAALAQRGRRYDQRARTAQPVPSADFFLVRNDTGTDLVPFAVLALDGPLVEPAVNLDEFQWHVSFAGGTPDSIANPFAILQEPAAAGAFARATLSGVTVCRVMVLDEAHTAAAPAAGDTAQLHSAATGPAKLLWVEAGTGAKWAVVRLGDVGAAGPPGPGGGGVTIKEVDGTPTIAADTLWVPNTALIDRGGGDAEVRLTDGTHAGLVSTTDQVMGDGVKTFKGVNITGATLSFYGTASGVQLHTAFPNGEWIMIQAQSVVTGRQAALLAMASPDGVAPHRITAQGSLGPGAAFAVVDGIGNLFVGATGGFTSQDGKFVSVKGGLIVSIS